MKTARISSDGDLDAVSFRAGHAAFVIAVAGGPRAAFHHAAIRHPPGGQRKENPFVCEVLGLPTFFAFFWFSAIEDRGEFVYPYI